MERDLRRAATSVLIWDWFLGKMIPATAARSWVSPSLVTHTCDDCWLEARSTSWGLLDRTRIYADTANGSCNVAARTLRSALSLQLRANSPCFCTDCDDWRSVPAASQLESSGVNESSRSEQRR